MRRGKVISGWCFGLDSGETASRGSHPPLYEPIKKNSSQLNGLDRLDLGGFFGASKARVL